MRRVGNRTGLAAALLAAACASDPAAGESAAAADPEPPLLTAELVGDDVVCSTTRLDVQTPYIVIDATEAEVLYGVHALGGLKNALSIERPAMGDPVVWDGVNHEAALVRLLTRGGASSEQAQRTIAMSVTRRLRSGAYGRPPPGR